MSNNSVTRNSRTCNEDFDVVVVGAGNAGLVAALAAHEAGARVLVLEAAPHAERGGNSRFSGGIFRCAHNGLQSLLPVVTDESAAWADRVTVEPYSSDTYRSEFDRASRNRNNPSLSAQVIDDSLKTVEWMAGKGVRWELTVGKLIDPDKISPGEKYSLPPGGALRAANEGLGLIDDLFSAVESAGIEVWHDAPVMDLVMDGTACRGAIVRGATAETEVRAVVVMAAGGFEANPEMRQRWLGAGWDLVKVRGTRFNMGTVLNAAMRVGAKAEGHWGGCHAVPLDADAPEVGDLKLTDKMSRYSYPYALLLNSNCERFVDEGEDEVWLTYAKTGASVRAQPGAWGFQLFDAKTSHLLEPRYSTGSPVEADDLPTLAKALGVDADALVETVEDFNKSCGDGKFDPFTLDGLRADPAGQPAKSNWAQRIDSPPFRAYPVTCGITFTYGGLKIDEEARVYDTANRVMPGLYATGELTGGFFFHNYPAGAGLMRGAVFGRIAGRRAARESTVSQ